MRKRKVKARRRHPRSSIINVVYVSQAPIQRNVMDVSILSIPKKYVSNFIYQRMLTRKKEVRMMAATPRLLSIQCLMLLLVVGGPC